MKFNPKKSRTLVIKKGKVLKNCVFRIGEERIPTVSEAPVKSLGKMFDETRWDSNNRMATTQLANHAHCIMYSPAAVWL